MHDRLHNSGGTFRWQTLIFCGVVAIAALPVITAVSLLEGLFGVLVVLGTAAAVHCYWRDLIKRERYRNDLGDPRRRGRPH